jgi:endonuclease-3 related protein
MSPIMANRSPGLRWRRIPGPPADPTKARLLRLHVALRQRFGPQGWWPARTPYEVAVGAVLAQHTAWTGAARAVASLRARGWLRAERLAARPEAELGEAIRAAGTYRIKARRLQAFTRWLLERFGGRFDGLRRAPLRPLRREMLAISGLGPETVDAILLYAADRPVFVADAYARRVLARHGLLPEQASYEQARAFLEAHLPSDPALLNEFHALLVAAGQHHCRTVAACEGCPLHADLTASRRAGRRSARPRPGGPPSGPARPSPSIASARRGGRAPARTAPRR